MSKGLPSSGVIFDGGITLNGSSAPLGNMQPDGHMSVIWPGQGHYSWDNPGQANGHWTDHSPHTGSVPGQRPPGAKGG